MPIFGQGVDASLGKVDYSFGNQAQMAAIKMRADSQKEIADSVANTLKEFQANKVIAETTNAENAALMQARPDLLTNAPDSVKKVIDKQNRDGTLGVKDSAVLKAFLNTSVTVQEQARKRMEDSQANEIASLAINNPDSLGSLDRSKYSNGALVRGMGMAAQYNQSQADIAKTRSEAEANNYKAQQARNGVTAKFFADPKAAIDYGKENLGLEDGEVEAVLDTSAGGGYYPRANQNVIEKNKNLASFIDASSRPPEFRNLTPTQQQVRVPLPNGGFVWQDVGSESEKRVAGFAQKQKEFLAAQNDQDRFAIAGQASILLGNGMFPEQIVTQWNKLRKAPPPQSGANGGPNVTKIVQTPTPNPNAPIVTSVAAAPKGAPSPAPAPLGNYGGPPSADAMDVQEGRYGVPAYLSNQGTSYFGNKPLRAQVQVVAPPTSVAAAVAPAPIAQPPQTTGKKPEMYSSDNQTDQPSSLGDNLKSVAAAAGTVAAAKYGKPALQAIAGNAAQRRFASMQAAEAINSVSKFVGSPAKLMTGAMARIPNAALMSSIVIAADSAIGKILSKNFLRPGEEVSATNAIGTALAQLTIDKTASQREEVKQMLLDRYDTVGKSRLDPAKKMAMSRAILDQLNKIDAQVPSKPQSPWVPSK